MEDLPTANNIWVIGNKSYTAACFTEIQLDDIASLVLTNDSPPHTTRTSHLPTPSIFSTNITFEKIGPLHKTNSTGFIYWAIKTDWM